VAFFTGKGTVVPVLVMAFSAVSGKGNMFGMIEMDHSVFIFEAVESHYVRRFVSGDRLKRAEESAGSH